MVPADCHVRSSIHAACEASLDLGASALLPCGVNWYVENVTCTVILVIGNWSLAVWEGGEVLVFGDMIGLGWLHHRVVCRYRRRFCMSSVLQFKGVLGSYRRLSPWVLSRRLSIVVDIDIT